MTGGTAVAWGLLILAGYVPLARGVSRGLEPLAERLQRPLFLESGILTLGLVGGAVTTILYYGGELGALSSFLGTGATAWWWWLAGVGGVLLYAESQFASLPLLSELCRRLGFAPPWLYRSTRWGPAQTIGSFLAPGVLLFMPLVNVLEELLWRGFAVYGLVRLGLPLWGAAVISAVCYASYHSSAGAHHLVLSGRNALVFTGLFMGSGSIWIAVVAHFTYNLAAWFGLVRSGATWDRRDHQGDG